MDADRKSLQLPYVCYIVLKYQYVIPTFSLLRKAQQNDQYWLVPGSGLENALKNLAKIIKFKLKLIK